MQPTMINSTDTPPLSVQHHTVDGIESLEALQEAVRYVVGRSSLWSSQSECQFKGSAEVLDKIKIPFTLCVTLKSTFPPKGQGKKAKIGIATFEYICTSSPHGVVRGG